MFTISYKQFNLTLLDMVFLLSNNDGYIDGDKKCIVIKTQPVQHVDNQ